MSDSVERWEYKTLRVDIGGSVSAFADTPSISEPFMDNLGRAGWELAGVVPMRAGSLARLIFKRRLES